MNGIIATAAKRDHSDKHLQCSNDPDISAAPTVSATDLHAAATALLHQHGQLPGGTCPSDSQLAEGHSLLKRLSTYGDSLPGTPAQMQLERNRVLALVASSVIPPFTFFHTVSAADGYWPELYRMIGFKDKPLDEVGIVDLIRLPPLSK